MTPSHPPRPPTTRRQRLLAALAYLGQILTRCPTELTELICALVLLQWGLVVALPADTFGPAPIYRALQETGLPELGWGLTAIAVGVGQIISLACRRPGPRVVAVALTGCFFFAITAAILVADPVSTGAATYATLAVACGLIYIRHRG